MGPKLYRDLQSNATDIRNRFNEGLRQNRAMGNVVGTIFKPLKEEYFKTSPSGPERFLFEAKLVCLYECISEKIKSRGFFSKLFHPIRTYKEKNCLNNFEKLLGKGKNPKRRKRIDKINYKKSDEDPFIKETKLVSVELSGGRFGFDISVENRKIYTTIERGAFLDDGTLGNSNVNPFMNFKNRGFNLSAEDEELYNQITERNNHSKMEMEEAANKKEEIVEEFDDDEKSFIDLPVKEDDEISLH